APKRRREAAVPGGTERILFVDDEEMLTDMTKQILERLGYHVVAENSSVKALARFRARPEDFDLVITDMTMPKMTGAELAAEMMDIRPDIPIILCTGFSMIIDEQKAKSMGIRDFVYKPIIRRNISQSIRRVLDGKV
ncbi:MAG: response regulator, partial [Desulfobacterales bacterium]|nr:response regulator [Desulfobacterales bacterium]